MAHTQDPTHPTGVAVVEGTSDTTAIRPRERKITAALDLKLEGHSWEDIALILGYPDGHRAQVAVETALEKQLQNDPQTRARLRDYTGRRLERLLRAVWDKALDPEHPEQMVAHGRALAVVDRHAKLFGLDAPTEHIVHTPTNDALQNWVADAFAAKNPTAEEDDIFDAEVVEPAEVESA